MDQDEVFERVFGHCAHKAVKIDRAIGSLITEISSRLEAPRAACIVAQMTIPSFAAALKAVPCSSELMRRYLGRPPAGAIRHAPSEFETLNDAMQQAIIAIVFQSLVRWRAFLLALDPHVARADVMTEDPRYLEGSQAYECLLGFDCLMADTAPAQAAAKIDKFVAEAMAHFMGFPDEGHDQLLADDDRDEPPYFQSAAPDLQPIAQAAWKYENLVARGQRYLTLDLAAGAGTWQRNTIGETLKQWASVLAVSSDPERYRMLHKALIAEAAELHPWSAPDCVGRQIPQAPSSDSAWRRCTRVLAMVHELHKSGYQKIRILPFLSGSGCYWRGWITFSDNMEEDGYHLIDWDIEESGDLVAKYTSGQDNEFFGWRDAATLNARQLAQLFTERFSRITERGQGCDWAYAGWLTDVLGFAELGVEHGGLVNLINHDFPMDLDYLARWQPPPPQRQAKP